MNVAFDPWIPVVKITGERLLISLSDALTDGRKYADIAVRPHERVTLMRLFLSISHAALDGPKNYAEWCNVPDKLSLATKKYLTDWKDSFELFHKKKPWLQVSGLVKDLKKEALQDDLTDWTPVSKLNFMYATGNNTTLFDHEGMYNDRTISLEETILSMLTFQCFSPGGLISQVYWNGLQTGKSSKDAPCVTASMVHAFIRGKTIQETIWQNMPTWEDIRRSYGNRDIGKPVWECPPVSFADTVNIENSSMTYVGRLVPMTRLICLHQSGSKMLMGDGLVYPPFTEGFPQEPSSTVVIRKKEKKEERVLLSFRPSEAIWRELSAMIVKRNTAGLGGPISLCALQDVDDCDLNISALARKDATIVDTFESVYHIPAHMRTFEGTTTYDAEAKYAEVIERRLSWAIEGYRQDIDVGWDSRLKSAGASKSKLKSKLSFKATTHYWTTVEKNLSLLFSHIKAIGTDDAIPTRNVWRNMVFKSACDAYKIACGQETPRQIRAFTKGWQRLTSKNNDTEIDLTETKED